jgi:hypothetical protein
MYNGGLTRVGHEGMGQISSFFRPGTRPAAEQQTIAPWQRLTLDEEFIERRMASVSSLGSEDDLSIAGQPQTPRLVPMVCQGHQANLHIILRGNKDPGCLSQEAVLTAEFGKVSVEEDLLLIGNH